LGLASRSTGSWTMRFKLLVDTPGSFLFRRY
jgi:hypothetical protein